jgi:hypothetical protein
MQRSLVIEQARAGFGRQLDAAFPLDMRMPLGVEGEIQNSFAELNRGGSEYT